MSRCLVVELIHVWHAATRPFSDLHMRPSIDRLLKRATLCNRSGGRLVACKIRLDLPTAWLIAGLPTFPPPVQHLVRRTTSCAHIEDRNVVCSSVFPVPALQCSTLPSSTQQTSRTRGHERQSISCHYSRIVTSTVFPGFHRLLRRYLL